MSAKQDLATKSDVEEITALLDELLAKLRAKLGIKLEEAA
jgi:hypothetical protein